jgi:hypothetical protein
MMANDRRARVAMLVGDPFTVHQKFVSRYQLGAADAK